MDIALKEFNDYPPRICITLSTANETSAPVELKVVGLKDCSFTIAHECELQQSNGASCTRPPFVVDANVPSGVDVSNTEDFMVSNLSI